MADQTADETAAAVVFKKPAARARGAIRKRERPTDDDDDEATGDSGSTRCVRKHLEHAFFFSAF